jgi:hypothetical protein
MSDYESDSDEDKQIENRTKKLTTNSNENQFTQPLTFPDTDAAADTTTTDGAVDSSEQMIGEYKVTKADELKQKIGNATDAYRVTKGDDEYFVFKGHLNAMTGGQKKSKSQKRGGKKQRQTKRKMGGRRRSNRRR